jgi:hypothetical protein
VHVAYQSLENWAEFSHDFVLIISCDVLDAGESASEGWFLVDHFQSV